MNYLEPLPVTKSSRLKDNEQRKHNINAQKAAVLDNIVGSQQQAARDNAVANRTANSMLSVLQNWYDAITQQANIPDGLVKHGVNQDLNDYKHIDEVNYYNNQGPYNYKLK